MMNAITFESYLIHTAGIAKEEGKVLYHFKLVLSTTFINYILRK